MHQADTPKRMLSEAGIQEIDEVADLAP